MSETFSYDDEEEQSETVTLSREDLRQLREAAKRASKLSAVERELVMLKAGVDVESPLGKMFVKAYEGELTPEKVREAWSQVAPLPPSEPPAPPAPPLTEAEKELAEATAKLTSEQTVEPTTPDPKVSSLEAARKALAEGASLEDAGAVLIASRAKAALEGDKRVILG